MWVLLVGIVLVGLYGFVVEPHWVSFREVHLTMDGLGDEFEGFSILHLSDLHGRVGVFSRARVRHALEFCDMIALTGDLFSPSIKRERLARILDTWDRDKLYYVSGNHDYRHGHLDTSPWHPDATLMDNRALCLRRNDSALWIAGIPDLVKGTPKLDEVLDAISVDDPAILLSHRPDGWLLSGTERFQLVLSGHTHGGQVRIPGFGAVFRHNHVPDRFVSGVYERPGHPVLITSRGLGMSELPVRFMARPEILRIILHTTKDRRIDAPYGVIVE